MPKMIQLRNVPDDLHRMLKVRAAMAGMSLSDYLLREVRKSAERPTLEELLERLKRRTPVEVSQSPAEILRSERQSRGRR
jgi:antitoxin FitA